MPFLKTLSTYEAPWIEWDRKANKHGYRSTFYAVNGDQYLGEWHKNNMHGQGKYVYHKTSNSYIGGWKMNKKDGPGIHTIINKDKSKSHRYIGNWKNGHKEGYGEHWYIDGSHYEGEWKSGKRHGWGRMIYRNGCIYEGQWENDLRHGHGLYRKPNLDRYEGQWKFDLCHGPGRYFYIEIGQFYEGVWMKGVPKCGEMMDAGRESAIRPPKYLIPPLQIVYADQIVRSAKVNVMNMDEYHE